MDNNRTPDSSRSDEAPDTRKNGGQKGNDRTAIFEHCIHRLIRPKSVFTPHVQRGERGEVVFLSFENSTATLDKSKSGRERERGCE